MGDIWFIGDSITQSNADGDPNGSPRKSLYDLLTAHGYTFTYTGNRTNNTDGLPVTGSTPGTDLYDYHSGVSGAVIGSNTTDRTGITQNIPSFWNSGRLASVKPEVILIMIGTNDVELPLDPANAPARLSMLVDTIYAQPGVGNPTIFLASIPPNRTSPGDPANVAAFNSTVPGIAQSFQSLGRDVYFVDQFTTLNNNFATAMQPDLLHADAVGDNILAMNWFAAIESRAIPEPTTATLVVGGLLYLAGRRPTRPVSK